MSLFNTANEAVPAIVNLFSNSDPQQGNQNAGGDSQVGTTASSVVNALRTPQNIPGGALDDNTSTTTARAETTITNRRLSDAVGTAVSIGGLSPRALNNMQSIVAEQSNIGRQDVTLPDGSVIRKAKDTQLSEGQRLQMVMTQLHGQCKNIFIRDSSSSRALTTSILLEALFLGLAGLIDCLAGVVGLDFDSRRLLSGLNGAARRGDVTSIASVAGLVGSDSVMAAEPNIINTALRNYERPQGHNRNQNANLGSQLASGLSIINPNWRSAERNGQTVSDLSNYQGMSNDAREVLSANPDTAFDVQLAGSWEPSPLEELVEEYYPRASANRLTA